MLGLRYERTKEMRDLEEAIQTARRAVELTPDNHPLYAIMWNNLGTKLEMRYQQTKHIRDLEETIQAARQAVESTFDGHPNQAACLNNLGSILENRYERTREINDLKEGVEFARRSLELTPHDYADRATCLNNLGCMLANLYERTGESRDLEEAISVARTGVTLTPVGHPDRPVLLNNLGYLLGCQYEQTIESKVLDEAITLAREGLLLTPNGHSFRATWLSNLGKKLGLRYARMGEKKDLEEAKNATRHAIELTANDHPHRASFLSNLGNILSLQYEQTKDTTDLEEAILTARQAAWARLNALPFRRIEAAAKCLKLLGTQQRVDEAINLGIETLDLLPSVHTQALDRNDQQLVVSTFAGVASNLCSFLISANRSGEAIEYLKQGRAVIIGQLLNDRSDLPSLHRDHPQLANQYQSLVDEVNTPIHQTTNGGVETPLGKRRREAAAELYTCEKEIRGVSRHERFMLGQTVSEMQESIIGGIIVIINITDFRSDAILISKSLLRIITLPRLSAGMARFWVSQDWSAKKKSEKKYKNERFAVYLYWLWYACVEHIVVEISALQTQPSEDLPRVWWIGSGLASSMPFHAAGIHRKGSKENAYCAMVSSYTPSIKALAFAQKQAKLAQKAQVAQDKMLIAAMPTTPKGLGNKKAPKKLPGVEEEMLELVKLAPSHIRTTVVKHPSADQVLEHLKTCRIAHFACHGTSDYSDPSNSGLILQKTTKSGGALEQDRLTVQRISGLRLKHAQIAYLSACSTAENKAKRLADEMIHVVSGFQVAGFPHVVGCLWPAGDSECVEVAKRFYSLALQQDKSVANDAASALREAVMAVREKELGMPLNWAQFVHYGA
ncbi:CHAT domain-containing protein [Mariannaea sp. PMI_226]|nr:CHAT domain-containing protein [Mariannaea sp. PMI_226]